MDCDMSYFIAGLPRSRTAWLSVFMSQSGAYCYHDGFNGCNSITEYKDKMKGCGDSSTGLTLIDLNKEFPHSKVVVIEKNEVELKHCIDWCAAMYDIDATDSIMQMNEKLSKIKGLRIKQSEINDKLEDIWRHLTNAKWNEKFKKLKDLYIESDPFNIDLEAAKNLNASIQQNIIKP